MLADSPLVYYRLNETNSTTAPNLGSLASAADGTYSDITTDVLLGQPSASLGLGTAARLDYGYLRVPDLAQGPLPQMTLEVWLNRQSDPAPGAFFAIWAGDGFSGSTLHLNLKEPSPSAAGPQIEFAVANGGPHPQFFPMWPTNEWHHLVVTRDGATNLVRVYLDGRFVSEGTQPGTPAFTDGNVGAWGSTRNLDALVDEFAIYPTVLSDARIAAHFNAAQLTLDPPDFIVQPVGATVFPGDHVILSAAARGQALAFQWFKNSAAIAGATNYTYTIDSVTLADGGTYALQASNQVRSVMSSNAVLTVSGAPKPVNLVSYFTCNSDTVTNTTQLLNAVAGRQAGQFRDASAGFAAAPTTITNDAKVGDGALALNGNTFLQLFDDAALNNLPAYSWAGWVRVDGFNDSRGVAAIFSPDSGDLNPPAHTLQISALSDGTVQVKYDTGAVLTAPAPSGWFHLAFTHDANPSVTNAILYINGVAVANGSATQSGNLASGGTTIGSSGWATQRLIGLLDDVRVYDGALAADKIAALPGLVPPQPLVTLVSHFTFDSAELLATNNTMLSNDVTTRANAQFRDAANSFNPAPVSLATTNSKVGDSALALNGSTFLQLFDDAALNNLPAYTWAGWVRVDGFNDNRGIAAIFSPDSGDLNPPAGTLQICARTNGTVQVKYDAGAMLTAPAPSGWFHLAFTHDAGASVTNAILYLNGVAVTNGSATQPANLASGGSTLGSSGWATQRLIGLLDDVRVYNGALSAGDIAALPGEVLVVPGATLAFSRSGNQLTLSWTAVGFKLQQNDQLGHPAGWEDVSGGGTSPVTATIGTGSKFYRLVKQ